MLTAKLSQKGSIVASIPNLQNWQVISNLLAGRFDYEKDGILDRTHLRFFTRKSVEELFWGACLSIEVMSKTLRGPSVPDGFFDDCEIRNIKIDALQLDSRTFQFLVRASRPAALVPRVCVVVLNWNGLLDTLECIESLKRLDYPAFEILLVDNGSTDGSVGSIRAHHPDISILENGRNLGYSGGNNAGVELAFSRGADYVLILNNDTIVSPDIITQLSRTAAFLPKDSIVGSAIYRFDRRDSLWMLGANWDSLECRFEPLNANNSPESANRWVREVDYIVGCALFLSRSSFERVGGFDEDFFLHYEEIDWCFRARRLGFRSFVTLDARLWHKISGSFGGSDSPLVEYFRTRNRLLWADKHLPRKQRIQIRHQTIRNLKANLLPPTGLSWTKFTPREIFWTLNSWAIRVRLGWTDSYNRARLRAVIDYYLKRFGDSPASVRHLH